MKKIILLPMLLLLSEGIFSCSETAKKATSAISAQKDLYPDGYYFITPLVIETGPWQMEWLNIFTQPVEGLKNHVSVRFRNTKTGKWIDIATREYSITRQSTSLTFKDRRIGYLIINGYFTPKEDYFILTGKITFKEKIYPVELYSTEGD
jgi:hypothetical protein